MNNRLNLWGRAPSPSHETSHPAPSTPTAVQHPRTATIPFGGPVQPVERAPEAGEWRRPPTTEDDPIPSAPSDRRYGKRKHARVPKGKQRGLCVSISVSEEEETILRAFAETLDVSFSEWARNVMFRAMGRKLPSRGN
jgi:hypothetical protein